jgi:hypothetical protein
VLSVADRERGLFDARGARICCRRARSTRCWLAMATGSSATRTSPTVIRGAGAALRSRRACWRRCCCWPTARGSPTSGRWRRSASICARRWRSTCRSTTRASTTSLVRFRARLLLRGRSGSCSSARSSWPPGSAWSRRGAVNGNGVDERLGRSVGSQLPSSSRPMTARRSVLVLHTEQLCERPGSRTHETPAVRPNASVWRWLSTRLAIAGECALEDGSVPSS